MSRPACRKGDEALCNVYFQGKQCCPHVVKGPAKKGSKNVFIDGKPALCLGDTGQHGVCCGSRTWICISGSSKVLVNGKPLVRQNDTTNHIGGVGKMIAGSSKVFAS